MIPKRKCRQYSVEYLTYGFIPAPQNEQLPMCLLCFQTPLTYFKGLRDKFHGRNTLNSAFEKIQLKVDDGLIASYNISKLNAQTLQPHTIGEALIIPVLKEVISTVMHENPIKFIQNIPISNNTVKRRIEEMGQDVELQLIKMIQGTEFALQLDESKLPDNQTLLMAYVRFMNSGVTHEHRRRNRGVWGALAQRRSEDAALEAQSST